MSEFRFKRFSVQNEKSALKLGTDAVLLGSAMTILPGDARMLDIGTGTGVIALMAAQRCRAACIDAIDIDAPSVEEAGANFASSPWGERLAAFEVDLNKFTPNCQYDLIFTNPPYYDSSLKNPDERSARARHTDSLSYSQIFAFAAEHLAPLPLEADASFVEHLPKFSAEQTKLCESGVGLLPSEARSLFVKRLPKFSAEQTKLCESGVGLLPSEARSLFVEHLPKFQAEQTESCEDGTIGGRLSMILPATEEKMLLRTAAGFGLYPFRLLRIRSTEKKPFSRLIAEFSRQRQGEVLQEELTILQPDGSRSAAYSQLTSEFYL